MLFLSKCKIAPHKAGDDWKPHKRTVRSESNCTESELINTANHDNLLVYIQHCINCASVVLGNGQRELYLPAVGLWTLLTTLVLMNLSMN